MFPIHLCDQFVPLAGLSVTLQLMPYYMHFQTVNLIGINNIRQVVKECQESSESEDDPESDAQEHECSVKCCTGN